MLKRHNSRLLLPLLYLASVPAAATATNLVTNGGFEQPVGNHTYQPGDSFSGWTSVGDGAAVSIVDSSVWQPAEGNQSLSFDTNGAIRQDLLLTPGQWYGLRFQMAGDPLNGSSFKFLSAAAFDRTTQPVPASFTFVTTGNSYQFMNWQTDSFAFRVQDPHATIEFDAGDSQGVALDDVRVFPLLPGDANGDGAVGFVDLLILAMHYSGNGTWSAGDFNDDNHIDFHDLLVIAQNYGKSVDTTPAVAPVPEPGPIAVVLAAIAMTRRSRRPQVRV